MDILGDFNHSKIDCSSAKCKDGSPISLSDGLALVYIIRDFYMDHLTTFPTRESNILDLLKTNRRRLMSNIYSQ